MTERVSGWVIRLGIAAAAVLAYWVVSTWGSYGSRADAAYNVEPNVTISIKGVPFNGHPTVSALFLEISDYECPFCRKYNQEVAEALEREFVGTRQIRYGFVNNPLPIHASARFLAKSVVCAGEQNQYWQLHQLTFRRSPRTPEDMLGLASMLPLDVKKLSACIESSSLADAQIDAGRQLSTSLNLKSTPAFVLATKIDMDSAIAKKIIIGAQPLAVFERAISEFVKSN